MAEDMARRREAGEARVAWLLRLFGLIDLPHTQPPPPPPTSRLLPALAVLS